MIHLIKDDDDEEEEPVKIVLVERKNGAVTIPDKDKPRVTLEEMIRLSGVRCANGKVW